MPKHIIIGLGGTGYEILRCLRRIIVERHPDKGLDEFPNTGFLYVDPDPPKDVDTPRWQAAGRSIALHASEVATIQPTGFDRILNNLANHPDLAKWLPVDQMVGLDVAATATNGAQQIRPFGRMLFSQYASLVKSKFLQRLNEVEQGEPGPTRVSLACSLCGGTGGGIFLDLAYSLKRWMSDRGRVSGFLVLPDVNTVFGDRYLPNAYAALKELNYFSVREKPAPGGVKPIRFHLNGDDEGIADNPFYNTYLFETHNQAEPQPVELSLPALWEMIAERLYLELTGELVPHVDAVIDNAQVQRAQYLLDPFNGNPQAQTFSSFGLSTILYPIDQISEIVAYRLSHRLAQRWRQERSAGDVTARVANLLNGLLLDDDHLLGNKSYHDAPEYPPVDVEVAAAVQNEIMTLPRENKSAALQRLHASYTATFRNVGMVQFYRQRRDAVAESAEVVLNLVRTRACNVLVDPQEGWAYALAEVDELIRQLKVKQAGYQSKFDSFPLAATNTRTALTGSFGLLTQAESAILRRERRVAEALEPVRALMATNRTATINSEAYGFGLALLGRVIADAEAFRAVLVEAGAILLEIIKSTAEKDKERSAFVAMQKADRRSFNGTMLFDPERVDQIVAAMDVEQALNNMQTAALAGGDLLDLLIPKAKPGDIVPPKDAEAQLQEVALAWLRARETLLSKSVADQLLESFPDPQSRVEEIKANLNRARPFVEFSGSELGLYRGQSRHAYSPDEQKNICVAGLLPEETGRRTSISVVSENVRDGGLPADNIHPLEDTRRIVFLSETTAFPLRLIRTVADLKKHYDNYLKAGAHRVALHIQRNFDPPLGDLFMASTEERATVEEEAFLVAWAEGWLKVELNERNGREEIAYHYLDAAIDKFRWLGSGWAEALSFWKSNDEGAAGSRQRATRSVAELLDKLETRDERMHFLGRLYGLLEALKQQYGVQSKHYERWDTIRMRFMKRHGERLLLPGETVEPAPFELRQPGGGVDTRADASSAVEQQFLEKLRSVHRQTGGKLSSAIETSLKLAGRRTGLDEAAVARLIGQVFADESKGLNEYRMLLRGLIETGPLTDEARSMLVGTMLDLNLEPADVDRVEAEESARLLR